MKITKVHIDGVEYEIPKMKFKLLKRAYPLVLKVQDSEDPMEMSSAVIEILSMAMTREPSFAHMTPEWIEDNLDLEESRALPVILSEMMIASGLLKQSDVDGLLAPGEAPGAQVEAPSTETSTPSSQNSLQQDAVGETGTS